MKSCISTLLSLRSGCCQLTLSSLQVVSAMETGVRKIVPIITLTSGEQKIRDIDDINYPFGFTEGEE